jgi:hypothetical protein
MQYYPGQPLSDLIRGDAAGALLSRTVADAGRRLAQIHSVAAVDAGVSEAAPPNAQFVRTLQELWTWAGVRPWLAGRFRTPDAVYAHLGRAVHDRAPSQVLLIDSRPKNTLIGPDLNVRFIDLSFAAGNPAQGLAAFLVAIDRLLLRQPIPRFERRLRRCQARLVAAYSEVAPASAIEDLILFYPWVLLSMYRDHRANRPAFAPALAAFYAQRLKRFVRRLDEGGDWMRAPDLLFNTDRPPLAAWALS